MVEAKIFNAKSMIELTPAKAIKGHFQTAPLKFVKSNLGTITIGGAGLYAIFYKGSLIYIGKFLGTRVDWKKGSILDSRWMKHLKALTLLGREVSFSKKSWSSVQAAINSSGDHGCKEVATLRSNIRGSDGDLMITDMGCRVSFEKYAFAEEIRIERGDPAEALGDLDFLYLRYSGSKDTPSVRERVSAAENEAIKKFRPRCNVLKGSEAPVEAGKAEVESTITQLMAKYMEDSRTITAVAPDDDGEREDELPQFEEKLAVGPESFQRLIRALEGFVGDREDAILVYTDTNGGDLRVRKYKPGGLGFVNVATLTLRLTKKKLVLRTNLPANVYARIGLAIDHVVNDRLGNETFLQGDLNESDSDKVLELIRRAITDQNID